MKHLARDLDDNVIPASGFKLVGGAHKIPVSASSAKNATPFSSDTKVISLYPTVDMYIRFGTDNTVTATTSDHFIPGGVMIPDVKVSGNQDAQQMYVAAIKSDLDGVLYISEKE